MTSELKTDEIHCECPEKGILQNGMDSWYDENTELPFVNHQPNECKCKNNLKKYIRNGKELWLCSNCCLFSDIEVETEQEKTNISEEDLKNE